MSLTKLDFKDNFFDVIICSEVLEHIDNDEKAFSEIARVLKEQRNLILTIPTFSKHNIRTYDEFGHVRPGYKYQKLMELCEKNNLKIEQTKFFASYIEDFLFNLHSKFIKSKIE